MDIERVTFKELVDINELKLLFENFSAATGFITGLVDHATNEVLIGTGWRDICVKFHRICPESLEHCKASNKELTSRLNHAGEIRIHHCQNGLIHGCTPIIIQGKHLADLFAGQVLFAAPDKEIFRKQAQKYGYDVQAYMESLAQVPVVSEERFSAMLRYLALTASMIGRTGLTNLKSKEESTKNEQRLQLATEGADLGMWDWDLQTNAVYFSPRYFSMFGYGPDELPYTLETWENLLHPEDKESTKQQIRSCLEKKHSKWSIEFRLRAKNGKYIWILGRGKVVEFSQDGSPLRAAGTQLDITATKIAEKTLKESEERFRELFNNMGTGVAIYEAVEEANDFIIKDINRAGLLSNHLELHQVVGKSVQEVFSGVREMGLFDVFQRVWKTGISEHFPSSFYKDARVTLWVENYVCKIPSGEVVAIFEDITDRKRAEEEIIRAKEEWVLTFDAMADIITIQDKDMRIVRANKAAHNFFRTKPGGLNGKYCYETFTGLSKPCPGCPLNITIYDKQNHSEIIEHKGLGKIFHVSSSPILDQNKEVQFLVHIAKDITEHKKMEAELFQAHKMEAIGTLAGGIAHDFNNILSAIIGFSELAMLDIPADSSATKDIDQVIKSSKRAADLVQQILTFSRKSDQRIEPVIPHLIIKEALKMLRSSLPVTIDIQEDIDNECGKIMADPTNIHQIIVNLCTNSLHAMENEKGILSVSLQRKEISAEEVAGEPGVSPGPFIVLEVTDTGQGMDLHTMERIFEPYFTTKEVGKGTGLGLAVIHGIIQDYQGFVRVKGEAGQGTTFLVHIPALQEQISTTAETETTGSLPTGTERILVVDDESMIVKMNKAMLDRLGYKVSATTDSLDALEKIRSDPDQFDLIITDQTMPNLTGAELTHEILKIKRTLPIVLCTGYSTIFSEEDALAIGIKKYVRKPVDRITLAKTVRQVLDEK